MPSAAGSLVAEERVRGYRVLTAQQYYITRGKASAWQQVERVNSRTHSMTAAADSSSGKDGGDKRGYRQLELFVFRQHRGARVNV